MNPNISKVVVDRQRPPLSPFIDSVTFSFLPPLLDGVGLVDELRTMEPQSTIPCRPFVLRVSLLRLEMRFLPREGGCSHLVQEIRIWELPLFLYPFPRPPTKYGLFWDRGNRDNRKLVSRDNVI